MKITIEPTDSLDINPRYSPASVTVEIPYDPDSIGGIIKNLIIPVLLGSGFQRETIDKYIEPFDED